MEELSSKISSSILKLIELLVAIINLFSALLDLQGVHFFRSNKKSAIVSIPELEITLERINGLEEDEEEDEYGEVINPSEYATQTAIELVSQASKSISDGFFKAWVSTDDSGGVVLTWSRPELDKSVRLVIPSIPERKIYLYHEMGDEYGVEDNVSAKILSHWLSWCNPK